MSARQGAEILLVEPSSLTGSIMVATAREMHMLFVRHVVSVRSARDLLDRTVYSGIILSLDDQTPALELLDELRCAQYKCRRDTPVVVTIEALSAETAATLKSFSIKRVLLKPFKVRDLISTVQLF